MEYVGFITLGIFILAVVGTLFKKIPLPLQTVMILVTIVNVIIGGVAHLTLHEGGGLAAAKLLPAKVMGGIIIHPLTALLAGLLIAGALSASGGFDAIKVIISKLRKSPIGMAGTVAIIVQLPLMSALPCGRILAAALLPVIFSFGPEEMGVLNKRQLIILTGAYARNAFGSCGPSPLGGVGAIGEGFLGKIGYLRAPQAFSLLIGTALVALFLKFLTTKLYPDDVKVKDESNTASRDIKVTAPVKGYISLGIFVVTLVVALFEVLGKVPVQTPLVLGAILIMIVAKLNLEDLMSGIILMPATAMVSGFLAAGSLAATGGFDALGLIFNGVAGTWLGTAGMIAILVQVQTILPLSCSRILTAAFVPVLYLLGPAGTGLLTATQLAIVMSAYIINATTSCGPSPLGGGGMMAEGAIRAETGYLRPAFSFASLAFMPILAAVVMKVMKFNTFHEATTSLGASLNVILITVVLLAVNIVLFKILANMVTSGQVTPRILYFILFSIGGAISGGMLAYLIDMTSIIQIVQGAIGGVIAGNLMVLMTPRGQEYSLEYEDSVEMKA
ncbi:MULTISPECIES: hypothetical protein [unclassified Candidatus Frackibacter]|uniref:hypothetical protein n=1 Tax=unclassified Candidatus Frackibacter TaxID=2648818 RepID=UPI000792C7A7|nr:MULTISPECIES: hypothetical protein [unclassified Candidatus Frackibacter]KXS43441.1 MAG: hypothetical protein AWU54_1022 [Candidatus Frackibacter sp. T328-2]SEM71342.1 hypothetical protein SAMN04488698_11335 [Candidatus Frackibacter sp. WG12]SFL82947.1 hypothetical protein SAMN04488699_11548 [Candidatus Frackibacter sp. WG13]